MFLDFKKGAISCLYLFLEVFCALLRISMQSFSALSSLRVLFLLLPLLAFTACKPRLLPATNVVDNKENRSIVDRGPT